MNARLSDRIAGAIVVALAIAMWIVSGSYTVAYGDPAAGGFALQVLVASAFAGMALLRGQFSRLMGIFRSSRKPQRTTPRHIAS